MEKNKKIILYIWGFLLLSIFLYYIYNPLFFTQKWFNDFLSKFWSYVLIIYLIITLLRWFLFIPSTILIFAWAVFLSPINLFIISMIWIIASSSIVYFFSEYLWIDKILEKQFWNKKIKSLEEKINKNWLLIVTIWSFTPIVPTDLICYIAWITKMKYYKFILWVILWETPLVLLYVLIAYWVINSF